MAGESVSLEAVIVRTAAVAWIMADGGNDAWAG